MKRMAIVGLLLLSLRADAHVGSPDVFFDGDAGPYHVFVTANKSISANKDPNKLLVPVGDAPAAIGDTSVVEDTKPSGSALDNGSGPVATGAERGRSLAS